MSEEDVRIHIPSTPSQRIIAAGIVVAFCYLASSVLVTLLFSVLLAYFLDPVVVLFENLKISRAFGAFLVVLVMLSGLGMVGYVLVDRVDQFGADWPKYREPLHRLTNDVNQRLERFEERASEIAPEEHPAGHNVVEVAEPHPARTAILEHLGGLYTAIIAATFVPFLVFFMLAAKREVWHATMQLFPSSERTQVKNTLDQLGSVLRGYVVGTMIVGAMLVLASWLLFWAMGMDYSFLTALVSGMLNLVPYLGVVLAWFPPILIGLKLSFHLADFALILGMLSVFHLLAANVLFPLLVGRRVQLNAVAVTISILFWGWMWGAPGLLLAIPITASIKVVCDHIEPWQPVGRWLGA